MSRPPVSVVVPFVGDLGAARSLLEALRALRTQPDDQVIVVDNTSQGVVPQEVSGVTVIRAAARRSSYHARNVGAGPVVNPWILFMDADCRPAERLLDDYFEESVDGGVGVVAGEVVGDRDQPAALARWARSRRGLLASHHQGDGPHPAGIAGNLMFRREAWDRLGGFDESVRSAADVELCWRAQELGFRYAYRPGALVTHSDPERLGTVLRQAWRYGGGRRWLRRRYGATVPRPMLARPLARSAGGVLAWTLTGRFERAWFKLVDGLTASASWLGYAVGDNRARGH